VPRRHSRHLYLCKHSLQRSGDTPNHGRAALGSRSTVSSRVGCGLWHGTCEYLVVLDECWCQVLCSQVVAAASCMWWVLVTVLLVHVSGTGSVADCHEQA
jgi:hypothetical protein